MAGQEPTYVQSIPDLVGGDFKPDLIAAEYRNQGWNITADLIEGMGLRINELKTELDRSKGA